MDEDKYLIGLLAMLDGAIKLRDATDSGNHFPIYVKVRGGELKYTSLGSIIEDLELLISGETHN